MIMSDKLAELAKQKHIALETYRKTGEPVRTPVWPMVDNGLVYVVTRSHTGKVKRLRNNPSVRIAPSSFGGEPKGEWVEGTARFVQGEEAERADLVVERAVGRRRRRRTGVPDRHRNVGALRVVRSHRSGPARTAVAAGDGPAGR